MWLCASCGLAQLVADPTVPEEPKATEPAALVAQAIDAVERVAAAGWLAPGRSVTEYGSPHGGSWLELLSRRGLPVVDDGEPADVVLDCFGLMHAADQGAALAERVDRVAPGGVLLLQYHSLATIVGLGQWNALRHGHYAYYSTSALTNMLATQGFHPRTAWQFELYGGTILLAAQRHADDSVGLDHAVESLQARETAVGVLDPVAVGTLGRRAEIHAAGLRHWLLEQRRAGTTVLGYGAASRAVALLLKAGVDRTLLPAVVDAAPAKHGLRMPGTDIPIIEPLQLTRRRPDAVLLFLPDLLAEVRANFPAVEASGGTWVNAETLASA
jgi:hypothetical protein